VNELLKKTLEQSLLAAAEHIKEQQSQLRLLAEAVLEAHIEANLCVDCDPNACPPCDQCCQCPACVLAREIIEVGDDKTKKRD